MDIRRLDPPKGRVRIVIDSDTKNDIDDQFALVYALLSGGSVQVESIYAAPFHNPRSSGPQDGMEQSYDEILQLLDRLGRPIDGLVHKGATRFMEAGDIPSASPAALDLVERALASPGSDPLYVIGIGPATNIASALSIEPRIVEHIVVLWLGGHASHWGHTKEFNLRQDLHASRLLFRCGVPLVHVPCRGVTSHLMTTLPEIKQFVKGRGPIGDYLYTIFKNHVGSKPGTSKVLWDMAPLAYLINPDWFTTELRPSPAITDQLTWQPDPGAHPIRTIQHVDRDPIFHDLFEKLSESLLR